MVHMKKTITSMILILSIFLSTPIVNAVFRTITVDGDPSDWTGIEPLVTDPKEGVPPLISPAEDIKAVYTAHDNDNLYFRMSLYEWTNGETTPKYYFYIDSIPGEGAEEAKGIDFFIIYQPGEGIVLLNVPSGGGAPTEVNCPDIKGASSDFEIEISVPWNCIGGKNCVNVLFGASTQETEEGPPSDLAPDLEGKEIVTVSYCPSKPVGGELVSSNTLAYRAILSVATVTALILGLTKFERKNYL